MGGTALPLTRFDLRARTDTVPAAHHQHLVRVRVRVRVRVWVS